MTPCLTSIRTSLALVALYASAVCIAGNFTHVTMTSWANPFNQSYSTVVSVPAAATVSQFGAVYYDQYADSNYMVNNGPLGHFTQYVGQYLNVSGTVAAGNYSIYQFVYTNGYSGTVFNW